MDVEATSKLAEGNREHDITEDIPEDAENKATLLDVLEKRTNIKLQEINSFSFDDSVSVRGGNYGRGCKWSPDGLCLLTCSQDHKLRVFELPPQLDAIGPGITSTGEGCSESLPESSDNELRQTPWSPVLTMTESGTIYDFAWYPKMSSDQPETCLLAATSQNQPIHLYDAYNGSLSATYRIYDDVDEVTAASCVAFDPTGERLYAGLKNQLRIFNVGEPGRDCVKRPIYNKKDGGVGGIVSCIAFNPAMPQVYAVGSYGKDLGVYLEPEPHTLCYLDGQKGGITHLQFSADGTKLCAGGRKDNEILVWDLRNPGHLYTVLDRKVDTNQRIYFDTLGTSYVASGSTDGSVTIWDLNSVNDQDGVSSGGGAPLKVKVKLKQQVHDDCVNGISLHPYYSLAAVTSGQRRLEQTVLYSSSDEGSESEATAHENNLTLMKINSIE